MAQRKAIVMIAVVILLALGVLTLRATTASRAEPVRVGYLPIYVDLPLFVAVKEKIFERAGPTTERRSGQSPASDSGLRRS